MRPSAKATTCSALPVWGEKIRKYPFKLTDRSWIARNCLDHRSEFPRENRNWMYKKTAVTSNDGSMQHLIDVNHAKIPHSSAELFPCPVSKHIVTMVAERHPSLWAQSCRTLLNQPMSPIGTKSPYVGTGDDFRCWVNIRRGSVRNWNCK